jgi:hypothetical protein
MRLSTFSALRRDLEQYTLSTESTQRSARVLQISRRNWLNILNKSRVWTRGTGGSFWNLTESYLSYNKHYGALWTELKATCCPYKIPAKETAWVTSRYSVIGQTLPRTSFRESLTNGNRQWYLPSNWSEFMKTTCCLGFCPYFYSKASLLAGILKFLPPSALQTTTPWEREIHTPTSHFLGIVMISWHEQYRTGLNLSILTSRGQSKSE